MYILEILEQKRDIFSICAQLFLSNWIIKLNSLAIRNHSYSQTSSESGMDLLPLSCGSFHLKCLLEENCFIFSFINVFQETENIHTFSLFSIIYKQYQRPYENGDKRFSVYAIVSCLPWFSKHFTNYHLKVETMMNYVLITSGNAKKMFVQERFPMQKSLATLTL